MPSSAQSQGQRANQNGRLAEHVIADTLSRRGVPFERQYHAGRTIFDTELIADFYVPEFGPFTDGLIIESKWQQVSGSAEEKLCFLYLNIITRYPCPVIVVIDGAGFRPAALTWLRKQIDHYHLFAVFSVMEFLTWCNNQPL